MFPQVFEVGKLEVDEGVVVEVVIVLFVVLLVVLVNAVVAKSVVAMDMVVVVLAFGMFWNVVVELFVGRRCLRFRLDTAIRGRVV
jgi:hypothetical protein